MYLIWAWPIVITAFAVNAVVSVLPYCFLSLFGLKKKVTSWFYFNARLLSGFLFWLLGLKINSVVSSEAKKLLDSGCPLCFFSNHTSMLDIPAVVLVTGAQTGFIAKSIITKIPYINLLAKIMKCVFIDRTNRQNSIEGIKTGISIITSGHSMLIFPEGTRSKTGEIAPFKPGSFRLAMESKTPILPITIKGLRQSVEDRNSFFGHYNAYIDIGDPVVMSMENDRDTRFDEIKCFENRIRETYASLGENNV